MSMKPWARAAITTLGLLVSQVVPARAQDAPAQAGPCQKQVCGIVVEWGPQGTPTTVDRRYGMLSTFPLTVLGRLQESGYHFTDDLGSAQLIARVWPKLVKAACDVVAGTGSADACTTIGEVRVEFEGPGESPKPFRVLGRCTGEGEYMTVPRFSRYVAEMFDYHLNPAKPKRPSSKC